MSSLHHQGVITCHVEGNSSRLNLRPVSTHKVLSCVTLGE